MLGKEISRSTVKSWPESLRLLGIAIQYLFGEYEITPKSVNLSSLTSS